VAGTICVACKLPNGFTMQLYRIEDWQEPVIGGGWKPSKRAMSVGAPVKLNGSAKRFGADVPWDIRSGAGLTHGVDADFFAKWMEDWKESDMVKGGFIFASAKTGDVVAEAKDKVKEKTGLEPLDRNNLPAEFTKTIKPEYGA
jgi:hypothetical protein